MQFVEEVYEVTRSFPKEEVFGMTSQLRRAAVSVPSNIAEGQSRATAGEFKQFLGIARGSLAEAHTQIIIANRLGYLSQECNDKLEQRAEEVGRLLNGLLRAISQQRRNTSES